MSCCKPDPSQSPTGKKSCNEKNAQSKQSVGEVDLQGMLLIKGGSFKMGTTDEDGWPEDGEGPVRDVEVSDFYIDETTVTNAAFEKFVKDTAYKTEAEKFGWSYVFHLLVPDKIKRKMKGSGQVIDLQWWFAVNGAYWSKPEGPGSNIKKRMGHPVVHVSWNDAKAYADWAGKSLATEAQWEKAARGGLVQNRYVWGEELNPNGKYMCNIFQGDFPKRNTAEDGYIGTAPAKSFPRNGFGLYNMSGNVWEWCADWFSPTWHLKDSPETRKNPEGPISGEQRIMRGGSYLCHDSYCNRYRVGARTGNTPDSSTGNCGFRCVVQL